jgi:hypothetical protein
MTCTDAFKRRRPATASQYGQHHTAVRHAEQHGQFRQHAAFGTCAMLISVGNTGILRHPDALCSIARAFRLTYCVLNVHHAASHVGATGLHAASRTCNRHRHPCAASLGCTPRAVRCSRRSASTRPARTEVAVDVMPYARWLHPWGSAPEAARRSRRSASARPTRRLVSRGCSSRPAANACEASLRRGSID